jgi:hypothetical protein
MVMALAAMGLDGLISQVRVYQPLGKKWLVNLPVFVSKRLLWVVILIIPLGYSLKSATQFGQPFLQLHRPEIPMELIHLIPKDEAGWISVTEFNHSYNVTLPELGLKLGEVMSPFTWKDHPTPPVKFYLSNENHNETDGGLLIESGKLTSLYAFPENSYAYIQAGDEKIPCRASALGGKIDVICDTKASGILFVTENYWTGWVADIDEVSTPLSEFSTWLSVMAPAGKHSFSFRYEPWDVWIGAGVSLVGLMLCGWLWFREEKRNVSMI